MARNPGARHARNGARYANLYARLLANTDEPENDGGCWVWAGKADRSGYGRFNLYVPGLGRRVTLQAHIALWVWIQASPASVDEFWLQYRTFVSSGLELDHLCVTPRCGCPDHVDPCTPQVNTQRRDERRGRRAFFSA